MIGWLIPSLNPKLSREAKSEFPINDSSYPWNTYRSFPFIRSRRTFPSLTRVNSMKGPLLMIYVSGLRGSASLARKSWLTSLTLVSKSDFRLEVTMIIISMSLWLSLVGWYPFRSSWGLPYPSPIRSAYIPFSKSPPRSCWLRKTLERVFISLN